MTTQEALDTFGTSIDITYYNGSEYVQTTALYTNGTRQLQETVGDLPYGVECLQYTAYAPDINTSPVYIALQMHPQYQIFDTTQLHTACFVYSTSQAAVPPYQSPSWEWYISGTRRLFEGSTDSDNLLMSATVGSDRCFYVPVDLFSQSTFSAYSSKVEFIAPVSTYNSYLYIYLAAPYLSMDAYGVSGSSGSATTTGQNQGGVDVSGVVSGISETNDILEEHSGLLGDIIDFLHYIGECIAGDESEVSEVEPIETAENPPDWDDAMSQVESALDDIPDMTASGGFIWSLYNTIMTTSPVIKFMVPFGLILTLLSYIWWKK